MELDARAMAYRKQTGRKQLTRTQWRRFRKKAWRDETADFEAWLANTNNGITGSIEDWSRASDAANAAEPPQR